MSGEAILEALREKDGGHRGRQVEAGDAGAHRDAEAGVGAVEQSVAEPVALGAEGEDRARRQLGRDAGPRRRGRSRPAAGRSPAAPRPPATGRAKWSPAAPRRASGCQGSLGPVVSTPAASAAAATRTQAPMLPIVRGSSSRTSGAGRRVGEHRREVDVGAAGDRDDAGARRLRHQLGERLGRRPGRSARRASRRGPEPAPPPAPAAAPGSAATASSTSAPKRSACLRAWNPSRTARRGVAPGRAVAADQRRSSASLTAAS